MRLRVTKFRLGLGLTVSVPLYWCVVLYFADVEGAPVGMSPETEPIPLIDNHVTVVAHSNHERKLLQETPI